MKHSQRGGALVEFAVVIPVAMFFLLGIMQMSWMLYTYHAVSNGARLGARWMAMHGANCFNTGQDTDSPPNTLCPASNAAIKYYVYTQSPGLAKANFTVTPTWTSPPSTWQYHPASVPNPGTPSFVAALVIPVESVIVSSF